MNESFISGKYYSCVKSSLLKSNSQQILRIFFFLNELAPFLMNALWHFRNRFRNLNSTIKRVL